MYGDFLGRTFGNDRAAARTALGTHVDDVVGSLDDVQIMLDDNQRVSAFGQPSEQSVEPCDILH